MKRFSSKQSRFFIKPICAAVFLAVAVQNVQANPTGASVVNGQASFAASGNTLTVTNTPGTIINWQGFSIGANEITRFAQQSAASTVLNRVVSSNPSNILGSLQSNGRVFLVNPNGIIFGAGATVDVAGLVATTLNISNADFLAGRHSFTAVPGAQSISNAGNLTAQSGGQIYLIAPDVENSGVINAPNGEILLAAGHSVELVDTTNPNLRVNITAPAGDVTNVGQLVASSGSLGLFGTVVRNSGTVSADSATMQGGKIVFKASQRAEISGTVSANSAALPSPAGGRGVGGEGVGGTIEVLGNQVGIMDGATFSANGAQGGGTVLVGGDYQGKNPDVPNANVTYVAPTATINADAMDNGNGGKVIVWADDTTRAYGNISARGGVNGGDGGFVETSGHRYLDVAGIRVNTSALNGTTGSWLLDPTDITISHSTLAVNAGLAVAGNTSTISDFDINAALSTTNVTISTTSTGVGTGDIKFDATGGAIIISSASTVARILQLNAENNIKFLGGATTFVSSSSTSTLDVGLSPVGKVITDVGSTVTLDGNLGLTRAWVALAKTWENSGTLSINGNAAFHIEHNYGAGASTLHNMSGGIVNAAGTTGWAIWSNACCQDGILINDGIINVTSSTAFEAAYSQSSTGTLNIANAKFINLQNANVLSGTFNIGTGAILSLPEVHSGARTFSGATINSAGTLDLNALGAIFSNTSLSYTAGNFTIPTTGITYNGNVAYSASGNLSVTSGFSTGGNINLTAGGGLDVTSAAVVAGGNMTVNAGGDLTLTAASSQARLQSAGTQTINFTGAGAHTLTLQGSNSNVAGASASLQSGGLQTITNAGTLVINLTGGSGVANTLNATNDSSGIICNGCATFNDARIQSDGGQNISATTITIQGGSGGNGNGAKIENKSTSVPQAITTTGAISITGGTGGQYYAPPNDSVRNDASIDSDGTQIIDAASIALVGGGGAGTIGGAFLTGKVSQDITTTGNLTLTGGASTTAGEYGLGAPAVIGEEFGANITLNVGLALGMTGGSGSASPALIGSAQGTPIIDITATTITMADGGSSSKMGVLTGGPTGSLTMTAPGGITQGTASYINTASLSASVAAGSISLAGPNKVNTVTGLSASGGVTYQSAQSFLASSVTSTTGSILLASSAGNISIGTLWAGSNVTVDAYGAILETNGVGVTDITGSGNSINLTSQTGAASSSTLAISADIAADANSINATASGGYGGIRIGVVGDLSWWTGVNLANTAAASGDIALNATGSLTEDDYIFLSTYNTANISSGGNMTLNCCLANYYGNLSLMAPNITATSAPIYAGNNLLATVSGDIRLNDGSSMTAINDVILKLTGATSTLYLNDAPAYTSASYILANAPQTIHVGFPGRSSGGVVIDGVETTTSMAYGSGFFVSGWNVPATLGSGLVINYSGASTALNSLINEIVQTPFPEEKKKTEDVIVVAEGSAPAAENTSTASLPVCK